MSVECDGYWKRPWGFSQGTVLVLSLVIIGMLLQVTAGPVNWSVLRFPVNILILMAYLISIITIYLLRNIFYPFLFIASLKAAVPVLCMVVVLTAVMGLIGQVPKGSEATDIFGFTNMLSSWSFVLVYAYMCLIIGVTTIKHIMMFSIRQVPFILNHLGLLLVLLCGTLGGADMKQLRMSITRDITEWQAHDDTGLVYELPFSVRLIDFDAENYVSEVELRTNSDKATVAEIKVNHPYSLYGWSLYQYGYDIQQEGKRTVSVLELVRDPWLPSVYIGIFMLLAGAVLMFIGVGKNSIRAV